MTTRPPWRNQYLAISSPIQPPPPVMTATDPFISSMLFSFPER